MRINNGTNKVRTFQLANILLILFFIKLTIRYINSKTPTFNINLSQCCSSNFIFKLPVISSDTCSTNHWLNQQFHCQNNSTLPLYIRAVWDWQRRGYASFVNTFLKGAPYRVVERIDIRAVGVGWGKEWVQVLVDNPMHCIVREIPVSIETGRIVLWLLGRSSCLNSLQVFKQNQHFQSDELCVIYHHHHIVFCWPGSTIVCSSINSRLR